MPHVKPISRQQRRKLRTRGKIKATANRPRLSVFVSNKHIYAQVIDDHTARTLAAASDLKLAKGTKSEKAAQVGQQIAELALKKKIKQVVFDRGDRKFHGRIKALAEAARQAGLEF